MIMAAVTLPPTKGGEIKGTVTRIGIAFSQITIWFLLRLTPWVAKGRDGQIF